MYYRKVLIALSLLVYSLSVFCEVKIIDNRDIEAFAEVTNKALENIKLEFKNATIITFTSDDNSKLFNDHIDGIIQLSKARIAFMVYTSDKYFLRDEDYECKGVCVFLFDSNLHAFNKLYHFHSFDRNFYVFYVHQATTNDLVLISQIRTNFASFAPKLYHIVAAKNEDTIDIVAAERFSPTQCNELSLNVTNQYSKKRSEWNEAIQPLTKANNFHGCMFKIPIIETQNYEGVDITFNNEADEVKITGPMFEIFKRAAEHFNFKINATGYRQDSLDIIDMGSGDTFTFATTIANVTHKIAIIRLELLFAIPLGEPYSEWEILGLAFDISTWILIGVTFLTAMAAVFVLNWTTQAVRDFVYGRKVTTPTLNIFIAFYGLSQDPLPTRNFARFILTLWIIWCLIIRTCYQGKLFEYLQGDQRKPEIQSIEEMLQKNLTFWEWDEYTDLTDPAFFNDKR